jgi:hypothetical protein
VFFKLIYPTLIYAVFVKNILGWIVPIWSQENFGKFTPYQPDTRVQTGNLTKNKKTNFMVLMGSFI